MTHNDFENLKQIQSQWKKQQQLIRRKYQISYNMTYKFQSCPKKLISICADNRSTDKTATSFPPIFCSKCHLDLSKCSCQSWKKQTLPSHRNLILDISSTDCSSMSQKSKSLSRKTYYVLLDWTNPSSLRRCIQTTIDPSKSLTNQSLQQLQELITNNQHVEVCHSIIDLILKSQFSLCQIYIDPSYYSSIENSIPFTQSSILADNTNLNKTLNNIKLIVNLLGVKLNNHQPNNLPTNKQREIILNEQIELIRSKVPYNIFRQASVQTQQTASIHSNSY